MANDESQKYQAINKAVVMYRLTGDVNTDRNAHEMPVGLCLTPYFVIRPSVTVLRTNPTWCNPGNKSSLKGEKLMNKPPKLKIFRRPTMTHEYIRHSAVFLQMCNIHVYEEVSSICTASLLVTLF